ncbi:hypothetical protein WR25_01130 isoform G [Diploscapter pachys]|uniref:Carboxypeptidase n=1 Tax=Diploscapter pachys TaxID=2018661 RepID=A0A2A2KV22_9BILA|nr:hypothetical protein WR25_01130 isoform G [Diploscapter pachys]
MSRYCIIILLTVCANLGQADPINSLPGSPTVKFKQYAGFLTVGDNKEDNLYYMFVESQNNPVTDPIVLWLSGGPGCSSLSTLLSALGPLLTAVENWEAIREFFKVFPQYANNDFYVAGASYGGVYVPTLVQTIMDRQSQYRINLKGFLIGNGAVSQQENTNTKMQFMYNHGMVDESTWQQAKSQCCNNDIDDCNWHAIDKSNTFCYNFVDDVLDIICDDINYRLYTQEVFETAPLILSALQSGLRGILYHGDIDMVCNVLLGSRFAYKLGFPVTKKAKEYFISGQVGGFHTQYGNDFHFVTARRLFIGYLASVVGIEFVPDKEVIYATNDAKVPYPTHSSHLSQIRVPLAEQITNLPGAPPISYKQYSGYYAVGDNKEDMLHYWFVESQNNPATDPLLLWLTGGPGCSSLSTLLTVLGPVLVNPDGATLTYNPYGWNKNASLIALEAPAGVGYSYSTGNLTTGDNKTAVENWEALVAFFGEFPQYRNNDLYITGASYSGIYVPTLVKVTLDRQSQFQMNLKGMAIGNGVVSSHENTDAKMQYLYNHGLVDDTQWQQAKSQCCNNDTDDCEWYKWYETAGSCYNFVDNTTDIVWYHFKKFYEKVSIICRNSGLDPYNLYEDCSSDGMDIKDVSKQYQVDYYHHTGEKLNPRVLGSLPCINDSDITTYLNRADVRKAIFVPTTLPAWSICNDDIAYTYYHKEIFETQDLFLAINQAGIKSSKN